MSIIFKNYYRYAEKSVPGSINIPFDSIDFTKDLRDGITFSPELSILMNNKGKMIIVIGQQAFEAAKVSSVSVATSGHFPRNVKRFV